MRRRRSLRRLQLSRTVEKERMTKRAQREPVNVSRSLEICLMGLTFTGEFRPLTLRRQGADGRNAPSCAATPAYSRSALRTKRLLAALDRWAAPRLRCLFGTMNGNMHFSGEGPSRGLLAFRKPAGQRTGRSRSIQKAPGELHISALCLWSAPKEPPLRNPLSRLRAALLTVSNCVRSSPSPTKVYTIVAKSRFSDRTLRLCTPLRERGTERTRRTPRTAALHAWRSTASPPLANG